MGVTRPDDGSAKRRALLSAALVLLVSLVAWWQWRSFVGSPQYALSRLSRAIEERDSATFERYLDVDALVAQFAEPEGRAEYKARARREILAAVEGSSSSAAGPAGLVSTLRLGTLSQVVVEGDSAVITVAEQRGDADLKVRFKMVRADEYWTVVGIENLREVVARLQLETPRQ